MVDGTAEVDGRAVGYADIGDRDGMPVIFCHGAPGCRLDLVRLDEDFARQRQRVVTVDRPGYGASATKPHRGVSDVVDDVARVADALEIDEFVAAGHSSGAPYALALAAALPSRVRGAVTLGGVTDMAWDGAWSDYAGIEVPLMRAPSEEQAIRLAEEAFGTDGAGFLGAGGFELPAPDVAALGDQTFASAVLASVAEAFRSGVAGYAQDIFVQGRPWRFDVGAIHVPVIVAHGELDTLVPLEHSRHTAGLVPSASLRVLPGHGHLTILSALPSVIDELAAAS